jgi:UDP:flavonoid glycosyltransferase YjiC (YdhE family)
MSKRILLATFGSYGDVNPFLGIAGELRKRGHEPAIASSAAWRERVEKAGFEFREISPGWDESVGGGQLETYLATRGVFTDFRGAFDDLLSAARDADALVTLSLAAAGPLVAQKTGLPWVSVVLEPLSFLSAYEPPPLPPGMTLSALKKLAEPWAQPVVRLKEELGLPPGGDPFTEDYLTADAVLALFSPLLGSPQPDWPPQTVVTGFVGYDQFSSGGSSSGSSLGALREFLDDGVPPVVFTLSSDAVVAPFNDFYVESVLAAKALGRRAVVLGLNIPDTRSDDVLMLSHVPFSEVFPHAAAVVHHGGVGTSAIALGAGRPTLVVPGSPAVLGSYAQPDTAARLARLGVARVLHRPQYNAAAAASELGALLSDPSYAIAAAAVAKRIVLENGTRTACDVIERVMQGAGRPPAASTPRRATRRAAANDSAPLQAAQADAYLHLLKRTLTRYPFGLIEQMMMLRLRDVDPALTRALADWGMTGQSTLNGNGFNPLLRSLGMDWPPDAETMIGLYRLDNLECCVVSVLRRGVPGDLVETGVWRGGASIFMRAALRAYGGAGRKVWLADSFQGLPRPDPINYPADSGDSLWAFPQLAAPLDAVKANFARYGLLDEQVRFLPGWFSDTLPGAPVEEIAVLRLDGDMYESTVVALRSLYHKVSPGGFVIVDDYGSIDACRQAVDDFRAEADIVSPLCPIDWTGVYWQVIPPGKARDKARGAGHKARRGARTRVSVEG